MPKLNSKSLFIVPITVVAAVIGVVVLSSQSASQSDPLDIVTLRPDKTFRVPSDDSTGLADFVADASGLYFLLFSQTSAEIIRTDDDGLVKGRVRLPESSEAPASRILRIDRGNQYAVLQRGGRGNQLLRIAPNGVVVKHRVLEHTVRDIAYSGGDLIILDDTAAMLRWDDTQKELKMNGLTLETPAMLLPTGSGSVAVIEGGSAIVSIVNRRSQSAPFVLMAPEIQGRMRVQPPPGVVENILYGGAASEDGRIFTLVSGYVGSKGAIVLEFSPRGEPRGRLRCKLPSVGIHKRNPDGYMLASKVGVVGNMLYLVSKREKMCALYRLR
jgi:hypothetical protein